VARVGVLDRLRRKPDYLRADNPRLVELRARYGAHPVGANPSLWRPRYIDTQVDLANFRADSAYRWQTRDNVVFDDAGEVVRVPTRDEHYALTARYVMAQDRLGLLDRLDDDDAFGNYVVDVDGRAMSTDLMDSLLQIDFLERHVGLDALEGADVLDIGAGYGRFAHRLATAVAVREVICTDAVAESTFLCEYYLRHRGMENRTRVVPLDEIEDAFATGDVTLAVNMHSFPEMPLASISWWLGLLARKQVRYLMVVPNGFNRTACESDGSRPEFGPAIDAAGYRLVVEEPKYLDEALQRDGQYPGENLVYELR
jgi:SAM-dependent methyltransferase